MDTKPDKLEQMVRSFEKAADRLAAYVASPEVKETRLPRSAISQAQRAASNVLLATDRLFRQQ